MAYASPTDSVAARPARRRRPVWRPNWAAWFVIVASALMWWGIIALARWAF
ncbi:MAG: hypothetical protein ACK41C_13220 [Phenylobacterium sp.]|uniref:hypothetical protein n=1 Tax=Phenylobacterium sp. TaxID=1871053 RepID=UPI0039199DC9